jgi:hypothetical protein
VRKPVCFFYHCFFSSLYLKNSRAASFKNMMKENFLVIPVLVDDRADKQFLVSDYITEAIGASLR